MHCCFDSGDLSTAKLETPRSILDIGSNDGQHGFSNDLSCRVAGRTPGFLFKAMRRQASTGEIDSGSTREVQILLAVDASQLHRSAEAPLWEVHSLFQSCASRPDSPADPEILRAAERMALPSMESK